MRFNRLSYQILAVFTVVIIGCLAVSGWLMLRISEGIITRKISEGDQHLARRIAQEVEAEMASVKPVMTLLAKSQGLRLMEPTDVKREIDQTQRGFPEIASMYVADVEGEQIARTGTEELENVSKVWGFQVAKGGEELISDIYPAPVTSEPMRSITLPIIDNGTVVGVVSADISFRRVMLSVMDIDIGINGCVAVVSSNGRVVAHTHMDQLPELDLSELPAVEAVLAGQEGTMQDYSDEFGRQVFGSYSPIWELGWGVVIQRPLADIEAEVGQLRITILLSTVGAMFLAVLSGWLMSRQISKPIRQLASASERIAQGDLSTPVEVKSSNEIGVLAHSFNQMVVSLKKSRNELEQRVAERTAELAIAKNRAEESDRLKSVFLASMSHELRTPLNSIIGFTGIILQGLAGPLNDEQAKQLGMIRSSALHLLDLINDVLDISKLETDQFEVISEPFDMRQVIEKVVRTATPLAKKKRLNLVATVMPEVGQVISDRRRVEQVLINLMDNAVKFTNQGEVRIECQVSDDQLVTRVVDTGIGIKPADMDILFETFRQIDTGLNRQHEGTGLGLSICKRLVEMLGGEIWAESEWGVGSTFTFTLPTGLSLRGTK